MIISKLQYFYYRVYIWRMRSKETSSQAAVTAQVAVSMLFMINAFTMATIVGLLSGHDYLGEYFNFQKQFHIKKIQLLIYLYIISLIIEWILRKTSFYPIIIEKYKNETEKEKRKGTILIWCYIIGSVSLSSIIMCKVG